MTISGERTTETGAATHLADHVALHAQHNAIDAVVDGEVLIKSGGSVAGAGALVVADDLTDFLTADDLTAIVYTTTITGDGTETDWPIPHNLGSGDVVVRVRSAASGTSFAEGADFDVEQTTVTINDVDNLTITPEVVVPSGHVWRVTVWAVDLLNGLIGGALVPVDGGGGSGVDQTDIDASIATHNTSVTAHALTSTTVTIASGAVTYNLAAGKAFTTSCSENITSVTISNAATVDQARLRFSYSGGIRTITWPSGWVWLGGVAPGGPGSGQVVVVDLWVQSSTTHASFGLYSAAT